MSSVMLVIPRPLSVEFAAYLAGYVARVTGTPDAIRELVTQRDRVAAMLSSVSAEQAAFRYAPDKWSVKEVVGHLSDVERVFCYRLLRITRRDETPLPGFDENAYVRSGAFDARPLGDLASEWVAVRNATIALVNSVAQESWERRVTVDGNPISARALFYVIVGHVDHHLEVLRARYGLTATSA